MRPIINMPEEDRATDMDNMHKIWQRSRVWFRRHHRGQTDRHTDILITVAVLRNRSRGQSKYHLDRMLSSNIVTHTHTHTHTHARTHCIKRPLKQSANISPQSCSEDAEESRTFEEGQCCDNGRHDIVYFLCPRQKKLHGLDKQT